MAGGDDDNEEEKSPKLRLVRTNPNARADRQIELAKCEVQSALSQFAAALLRTIAGNDTEAVYLIRRLALVVDAINKFEKQADRGMSAAELQEALRLPEAEMVHSADDDWRYRRWRREDGFDDIVKGALRLAAHKLLGEDPAFGGMHSERVIERGIKTLEELRRPPPPTRPRSTKDLAGGWEDLVLSRTAEKPKRRFGERLASAPKASAQKSMRRRAGFDEDDLKELRKAIKAKDNKRIAELTAKINRPSFEDPE
ncbi:hypothetical protein [Bradyrhizobium yuanmingense]|uniref:hypothetical protein n=1 Tax=Bradyrhizobium yuanmingense TaxID=108015 RepID=UPI001CD7C3C9|nr:hypothetical protein [Bradyrhizobium yuanmingense]MCA1527364.1 hypothetical protein [Bradyrhizobium yuanmingense]